MKNLILALIALTTVSQAHAESTKRAYYAQIKTFQIQADSELSKHTVNSGSLMVDTENNMMSIQLQPSFHCPAGAMCSMVMPAPLFFTAPIQDVRIGDCGETIYSGEDNKMTVDGTRQVITVTDNSRNFCQYIIAVPATEIVLTLQGLRPVMNETHVMTASRLK